MPTPTKTDEAPVPTTPDAWCGPKEELVTLPSGNVALCHKPNTFFLSKSGQVPEKVRKAAEAKDKAVDEGEDISPENVIAVDIIADFLISKSFVRPRVSILPGQKNTVYVNDISAEDKGFILDRFDIKL
jgi:hypothetical protein